MLGQRELRSIATTGRCLVRSRTAELPCVTKTLATAPRFATGTVRMSSGIVTKEKGGPATAEPPFGVSSLEVQASCASTGRRLRRIAKPTAPKPSSINAQVAGSGTAAVLIRTLPVNDPLLGEVPLMVRR